MDRAELDALSIRHVDRLRAAIEAGNREEALRLLEETLTYKKRFHDLTSRWMNILFRRIGELGGDAAVLEVQREYARTITQPAEVSRWEAARAQGKPFPLDDYIQGRAAILSGYHDQILRVEEDEEKYTLTLDPCETGGRLLIWNEGSNPASLQEKHPEISPVEGFQYFCVHCPVGWELGWYERYGWPLVIFDPPKVPGDPCIRTCYKDPRKIPDEYYQRTGLERKL